MSDRAGKDRPISLSAKEVRQSEVIPRKRWQRGVFFTGLAGVVAIALP